MIDIPQNIKNKFIIRRDYLDWISKETSIFAYLDLTNMFHWQDVLGWRFRIEDAIEQLFTFQNIKEVKVYYGKNEKDLRNSEAFHNRIKKTGAILKTKPMKFIAKTIEEGMFFQRKTLTLFEDGVRRKIQELIDELQKSGIIIEEQKCNFDVEKVKNKKIGIVGVRNRVAGELHRVKDIYIDFGNFYTGQKTYIKSENPAFGGTA